MALIEIDGLPIARWIFPWRTVNVITRGSFLWPYVSQFRLKQLLLRAFYSTSNSIDLARKRFKLAPGLEVVGDWSKKIAKLTSKNDDLTSYPLANIQKTMENHHF